MYVLNMLACKHQVHVPCVAQWAHVQEVPSLRRALAHPLPRGPLPQVVDIMRVNVDKVLERDQKLSELDDRADALQAGASQFETSAAKLKRKYWWKNLKMMIILGVICAIILIIIIVYFST
ncbi:vesicle-associated membrane protein 2 isoform X2 [Arvicola amphibius]|uniref:vesicle-associated membrane protein 2 isoform X2 n=1 Tax=Arvicola amphibius TaxID=1047088 RepID=UPI0018E3328B|nr:vesicle-associated membrane protein 2 isoform X2 [Arvicola amphibius]